MSEQTFEEWYKENGVGFDYYTAGIIWRVASNQKQRIIDEQAERIRELEQSIKGKVGHALENYETLKGWVLSDQPWWTNSPDIRAVKNGFVTLLLELENLKSTDHINRLKADAIEEAIKDCDGEMCFGSDPFEYKTVEALQDYANQLRTKDTKP